MCELTNIMPAQHQPFTEFTDVWKELCCQFLPQMSPFTKFVRETNSASQWCCVGVRCVLERTCFIPQARQNKKKQSEKHEQKNPRKSLGKGSRNIQGKQTNCVTIIAALVHHLCCSKLLPRPWVLCLHRKKNEGRQIVRAKQRRKSVSSDGYCSRLSCHVWHNQPDRREESTLAVATLSSFGNKEK